MASLLVLQQTWDALQRNPVLFVPVSVLFLFLTPQLVSQSISPGLANFFALVLLVASVFVLPFVQGGLIGMADDALTGRTSLAMFVKAGKRNYVPLLGAFAIIVVITVLVGLVMLFAGVATLFALYPGGAGDTTAFVVVILTAALVVALVYLLFMCFIQFYPQVIVLDRCTVVGSLKRSAALTWRNLVRVGGYSVIIGLLSGVIGGLVGTFSVVVTADTEMSFSLAHVSLIGVVVIALVVVAVGSLVGGFVSVFSVAFYRTLAN